MYDSFMYWVIFQLSQVYEVTKIKKEDVVDAPTADKIKAVTEFVLQLFLKEIEDLPHQVFLESV